MKSYTAKAVVRGKVLLVASSPEYEELAENTRSDLVRNAKAALKNGTTTNLAPQVGSRRTQ